MLKSLVRRSLEGLGYRLQRIKVPAREPDDVDPRDQEIWQEVRTYTMTGRERTLALIASVRYVISHGIPGDLAECGVWRGGSAMAMALTLMQEGDSTRKVWLFDTFAGMTPPSDCDVELATNVSAALQMSSTPATEGDHVWCIATLPVVTANMVSTGFPTNRMEFVQGDVSMTLREGRTPIELSLLRLDTDWYDSTSAELEVLYPRLAIGGVCILDDYGHWLGAKLAVDQYFAEHPPLPLMTRMDYAGRLLVKMTDVDRDANSRPSPMSSIPPILLPE